MARLKRMLMCALLRIDASYIKKKPRYIRVLGIRTERRDLLSGLAENANLPVILSARDTKRLDAEGRLMFERDCFASDVFAQLVEGKPHADFERPLLTI